jgi:hypothetical protein
MKQKMKTNDFNFSYTGSNYTEKDAIENNFEQLTGKKLRDIVINKTFSGDYPMGYKFVTEIHENGKVEGMNHVGSYDFGNWMIDMEEHTLLIKWNNGWVDTFTRAFEVNGNIEFYDADTGKWRTTFKNWATPYQPA